MKTIQLTAARILTPLEAFAPDSGVPAGFDGDLELDGNFGLYGQDVYTAEEVRKDFWDAYEMADFNRSHAVGVAEDNLRIIREAIEAYANVKPGAVCKGGANKVHPDTEEMSTRVTVRKSVPAANGTYHVWASLQGGAISVYFRPALRWREKVIAEGRSYSQTVDQLAEYFSLVDRA